MRPLPLPLALPLWELAYCKATRAEMTSLLGEPHFIETDGSRTASGSEDCWAFVLSSRQRILVNYNEVGKIARLIADPPDLESVIAALGLTPDDPRLHRGQAPFLLE